MLLYAIYEQKAQFKLIPCFQAKLWQCNLNCTEIVNLVKINKYYVCVVMVSYACFLMEIIQTTAIAKLYIKITIVFFRYIYLNSAVTMTGLKCAWTILLSYSILFSLVHCQGNDPPEVEITSGRIRGHWERTKSGIDYAAFTAVPYAKSPVCLRKT